MRLDLMIKVENITTSWNINSHGTGGAGYYEHRGVIVALNDGQIITCYYGYSSAGHGTFKELKGNNTEQLNGRMLSKHQVYRDQVNEHFNTKVWPRIKALEGQEFKNILAVKRALR